MTCKLMFTSALQSSVAIDEVLIKVNDLEAKPIKVMRNNTLVNMTSSEMLGGAEYSSTYKHRWCDAYTKLELTYSSSANAWIANADDVVMSYVSTDSRYIKYADGLIEQKITKNSSQSISAGGNSDNVVFNFLLAFTTTDYEINSWVENNRYIIYTSFYNQTVSSCFVIFTAMDAKSWNTTKAVIKGY